VAGIIDDATRAVIASALDGFLLPADQGGLGKYCRLVYPARVTPCSNCVIDPIGKKSANRPRSGAPVPFSAGQPCPVCSGQGTIASEASETLVFGLTWEPKKFVLPAPAALDLRTPNAACQVKGFLKDAPKLMKANYVVLDTQTEGVLRQKFKLAGEPGSPGNIVQGRYFYALLGRWNG
jgi:hypothetical protein